jgi:pSer/pThr/pTyr-binding forkhead associated (FHA) protein
MTDPRLNSIHLEAPRREEFRHAREVLLNARGNQTITAEKRSSSGHVSELFQTAIQQLNKPSLQGVKHVLMDKDYVYPLKVGLNTVGRMPDNDVVIEDPYVSRRHCAVLVHAGNFCEIHDVASRNGTLVNGRKINGPTRLRTGDEITMCDKRLVFMTRSEDDDNSPHGVTLAEGD